MSIRIGGGARFSVNARTSVFAQLDIFTIHVDGGSDSGPRIQFGVVLTP